MFYIKSWVISWSPVYVVLSDVRHTKNRKTNAINRIGVAFWTEIPSNHFKWTWMVTSLLCSDRSIGRNTHAWYTQCVCVTSSRAVFEMYIWRASDGDGKVPTRTTSDNCVWQHSRCQRACEYSDSAHRPGKAHSQPSMHIDYKQISDAQAVQCVYLPITNTHTLTHERNIMCANLFW